MSDQMSGESMQGNFCLKKNPTTTKSNKETNNTVTTKPTVQPLQS